MTTEGAQYIAAAVIAAVVLWIGYDLYQESTEAYPTKSCSKLGDTKPWKDKILFCIDVEGEKVWHHY